MQTIRNSWRQFALVAVLVLAAQVASATNLGVNLVLQRTTDANGNAIGNEWCWAASSKMILDYYGYPQTLFAIVAYGIGDSTYDTWNYLTDTGSESRSNVHIWEAVAHPPPAYALKSKTINPLAWNGIGAIIKNFSNDEVQTQRWNMAISQDQIIKEINDYSAPFVRRIGWDGGGGHFTVCYGANADASTLSIHDPWYGDYVGDYAILVRGAINGSDFTWTHTLTTSKILDVVFLFDTTGSMQPYISDAQASATALLDEIDAKFKNYRVAVANYKDFYDPDLWANYIGGQPGDYPYQANLAFTTVKADAVAAINGLPPASGGGDIPEALFTALINTLQGNGLADANSVTWRPDPARRMIIFISDAPGHDPEPWSGGYSFNDVVSLATAPALPIAIHGIFDAHTPVDNLDAQDQFNLIAGGTGGSVVSATDAGGTGAGLQAIVDSVAASPRFPQGDITAIYPTFSFEGIGDGSMGADATGLVIELQKMDPTKHVFKRLRLISLKDPKLTVYPSTMPLAQGMYQWRLGFKRPGSALFLPSVGEDTPPTNPTLGSPVTTKQPKTETTAAKVCFEPTFTQFNRLQNIPADVNTDSFVPSAFFTATAKTVMFKFGTVAGATSYWVQITDTTKSRVFKRVTLKPPKHDPNAAMLTMTLTGFTVGHSYSWQVEGLNYDRPRPGL